METDGTDIRRVTLVSGRGHGRGAGAQGPRSGVVCETHTLARDKHLLETAVCAPLEAKGLNTKNTTHFWFYIVITISMSAFAPLRPGIPSTINSEVFGRF